jgi:hypothetical protein
VEMQKAGSERYVMLPPSGQDYLVAGDYYLAVVSEGTNPDPANSAIGTGTSSAVLTSVGALAVTNLGTATLAGVSQPVGLAGGQLKAYQFNVTAGTASLEVRLDNRVGDPIMALISGPRLPIPFNPSPYIDYGFDGGQSDGSNLNHESILTIANPAAGTYSLIVRAGPIGDGTFPNATANLIVRQKANVLLNFAASQNGNGFSNSDSRQMIDGEHNIYQFAVPTMLDGQPVIGWVIHTDVLQGDVSLQVYKDFANPNSGVNIPAATAVVVPPYLTPGDTWYVRVHATGLTNYTITSRPVRLGPDPLNEAVNWPVWQMPVNFNVTFGDSGNDSAGQPLPGDRGVDLAQGEWHFYAVDVPVGNAGLLRTELQAISGNPDLYIREDGVPTTDHLSSGNSGSVLYHRQLIGTTSEYGNWVPLDGRTERQLRPGRWVLGVKANGNSNVRYRLIVSTGAVQDLSLNSIGALGVNISNGGSGYTSAPSVTFSGGGGNGATANAIIQNGSVVGVNVISGGNGYTALPTVAFSGGGGAGATASATLNQILADNDWRYYRFTVPADAPNTWSLTFSQQVGDVVMWLRDSVPPGQASYNSSDYHTIESWSSDNKNQGPYNYLGQESAGTYNFTTPPLRPGHTYFAGFRSNNSATFSVSSATSGGTIGVLPTLSFYGGMGNVSVPGNSSVLYQIPVPSEATRFKYSSTHPDTVSIRIEQGTPPGTTGPQHFISSGADSSLNLALSTNSWPWQPNQTYYVRIVNSAATAQAVTINVDGKNSQTEDEDNDGLPDAWEIQYFGNTNAYTAASDPDNDGQTNLFEYTAGTAPNDPNSRFALHTASAGAPGSMQIIFGPIVSGRSYVVETKTDLSAPNWIVLTGTTQIDSGNIRTVTDPNANGAKKFYRVQISIP